MTLPPPPRPSAPDARPRCHCCRDWMRILLMDQDTRRFYVCERCDFADGQGPPYAGRLRA